MEQETVITVLKNVRDIADSTRPRLVTNEVEQLDWNLERLDKIIALVESNQSLAADVAEAERQLIEGQRQTFSNLNMEAAE